jgi:hypothetical protein
MVILGPRAGWYGGRGVVSCSACPYRAEDVGDDEEHGMCSSDLEDLLAKGCPFVGRAVPTRTLRDDPAQQPEDAPEEELVGT